MKKQTTLYLTLLLASLFACEEDEPVNPKIGTEDVIVTSGSSFSAKATITNIGTIPVLDYGFVYSRNNYLDVNSEQSIKISMGAKPVNGPFQKEVTIPNSAIDYWNTSLTYFVRAFLTNEKGTVYGVIKSFTFPKLSLSSIAPLAAKAGDVITITGNNFSEDPNANVVKFNNVIAIVKTASATKLTVEVPAGITYSYYDYSITITILVGPQYAQYQGFKTLPSFYDFSPKSASFGDLITVSGSDFYGHSYSARLGLVSVSLYSITNNSMTFSIPFNITTEIFKITVVVDNSTDVELPGEFNMIKPVISDMIPSTGISGSLVTLTGSGYNIPDYYQTNNTVKFGTVQASIYEVTPTQIKAYVPSNLTIGGSYDVTVFTGLNTATAPVQFTVVSPSLTDFSPKTAAHNTYVALTGTHFGNVQGTVLFGSVQGYIYSWTDASIQVQVPPSYYLPAGTYKITVNAGGQSSVSTDSITIE